MNHNDPALRGLWLAIIVLGSLFAATAVGELIRAAGAQLPVSLEAGAGTFVSLIGLGLAARRFLTD
jgi:hypothetical protein